MTLEASTIAATDHAHQDGALIELLAAYQYLQAQNIRMASALSSRLGVGPSDLRVLLYVHRSPDATPKEIAARLEQTSGSVTALLDRLERSGHLLRAPHPTDRRSLILSLTDPGREAVAAVRAAYRDAFAGLFPDDEVDRVADVLRSLGSALAPA